jgi:tryptophan-rich sensory protein
MRNLPLAASAILIVGATILWITIAVRPRYRWVALAQAPYFARASLATVLRLSITATNWGKS